MLQNTPTVVPSSAVTPGGPPSQVSVPFLLRLPQELHMRLSMQAQAEYSSLQRHIIWLLTEFGVPMAEDTAAYRRLLRQAKVRSLRPN